MKRPIWLLIPLLVIVAFFIWKKKATSSDGHKAGVVTSSSDDILPTAMDDTQIGDEILSNYGSETTTVREDLLSISYLMENFEIITKSKGSIPLGSNEDFVEAFRGKNPKKIKVLRDDSPYVNKEGQLVDRFGVPLFFHVQEFDRIAVRSAGPDQVMWTADDEHLTPGRQFLTGEQLQDPFNKTPNR